MWLVRFAIDNWYNPGCPSWSVRAPATRPPPSRSQRRFNALMPLLNLIRIRRGGSGTSGLVRGAGISRVSATAD